MMTLPGAASQYGLFNHGLFLDSYNMINHYFPPTVAGFISCTESQTNKNIGNGHVQTQLRYLDFAKISVAVWWKRIAYGGSDSIFPPLVLSRDMFLFQYFIILGLLVLWLGLYLAYLFIPI